MRSVFGEWSCLVGAEEVSVMVLSVLVSGVYVIYLSGCTSIWHVGGISTTVDTPCI